ncbi:MAG: adenylate/guanylate cyclase domain-containing protein [Thermodesulfobacteriota bacterium]
MSFQLHIIPSVGKRWSYPLDKPLIKIGRAVHCDVVIPDVLVSREHCQIQVKPEGLFLEDLNSVNGTLVNGQRITRVQIKPRDRIRVGLSEMAVEKIQEEKGVSSPVSPGPKDTSAKPFKATKPDRSEEPSREVLPKAEETKSPSLPPSIEKVPSSGKPMIQEGEVSGGPSIALVSPNQKPPLLLVGHPQSSSIEALLRPLEDSGVVVKTAANQKQIQTILKTSPPDCVLLCCGLEGAQQICQEIKSTPQAGPIVLLLEEETWEKTLPMVEGGADEVLRRPDPVELQVRLRNLLELHRLRKEASQLNSQMEKRVSEDVSEVERITRLKRYLSPQLVAAVLSGEESHVLKPTRQEVSIVFSDLRNFTHFSETAEPEEIMSMLSDFHTLYGEIIFQYDGTLERFAGDGVMVFFGAPVPFKDHAARAVAMAVTARERLEGLRTKWKKLGYNLDVSFGIATGFVYVGNIGFEGRMDYAAIGKTTNLAARLCAAAKGGEILINRKTLFRVEDLVEVEEIGALEVKGFSEPVTAYNVLRLKNPYLPIPVE